MHLLEPVSKPSFTQFTTDFPHISGESQTVSSVKAVQDRTEDILDFYEIDMNSKNLRQIGES